MARMATALRSRSVQRATSYGRTWQNYAELQVVLANVAEDHRHLVGVE